jgi:hypothetical protein
MGSVSCSEAMQFATSMLTALYGPESTQLKQFRDGCSAFSSKAPNPQNMGHILLGHALGTIKAANAELKTGLIVRLRVTIAGELLTELIGLAKEVLEERTDAAKNTGAVLVAAAFENLIRRMGEELAGVTTRQKLQEVIAAWKDAMLVPLSKPWFGFVQADGGVHAEKRLSGPHFKPEIRDAGSKPNGPRITTAERQ